MTYTPQATTGVIWYNPIIKEYQYGSWANYSNASREEKKGVEFEVLYEMDGLTSKLASKIVKELNLASNYA